MLTCGGARSWLSRRDAAPLSDDDLLEEESRDSPSSEHPLSDEEEIVLCEDEVPAASKRHKPTTEHGGCGPLMSKAMYDSVKDIFGGLQCVKHATGDCLLRRQAQVGRYLDFESVAIDDSFLEFAGHLPAIVGHSSLQRTHHADVLTEQACPDRCGDSCSGDCRVRAFVYTAGHGTDYFYGSHMDVALALSTGSETVHIWDELEQTNMKGLKSHLQRFQEVTWPGLAMKTTELKSVPGQVLYHCDFEAWARFCLEHPLAELDLRFRRLDEHDSAGNVTGRKYGAPSTSRWQELMEQECYPSGLPQDTDLVGMMHAMDISDMAKDGSRKAFLLDLFARRALT